MDERVASLTSMMTALMRSVHGRVDPKPIIDDPWGDRLVRRAAQDAVAALMRSTADEASAPADSADDAAFDRLLRGNLAYDSVILRARYAEDAVAAALTRGVRQYVLIGAGFDSYALRRPDGLSDLRIFEVDHPATQDFKRRVLAQQGVTPSPGLHFAAADLAKTGLRGALTAAGFDVSAPAIFVWLGVTMYLTREANLQTLRAVAEVAAAGSALVFNYMDSAIFTLMAAQNFDRAFFDRFQQAVASAREPLVCGFAPAEMPGLLTAAGHALVEDVTDAGLVARYDGDGANGLRPNGLNHTVRTRMG